MNVTVNLTVAQSPLPVIVHVVQGNTEIPVDFHITDYTIPAGSTARFYLKKKSGAEVYNNCTISGNVITLDPTAQTFAEAGCQAAQLQVEIGENFLLSFPMTFDVAPNIIDDSAIESSNEYGVLESLLQEAKVNIPAAGEAAEAANQAAQSANNAANAANQAAGTASQAATAATNAAGSANTAAGSANQAATAATTAAGSANTAASAANQAKQDADTAAGAANNAASSATTAAGQANTARDAANAAASAANTAAGQANTAKDAANSAASAATTAAGQANTAAGAANTAAGQANTARDSANQAATAANQAAQNANDTAAAVQNQLVPTGGTQNQVLIKGATSPEWSSDLSVETVATDGVDLSLSQAEATQLYQALNLATT